MEKITKKMVNEALVNFAETGAMVYTDKEGNEVMLSTEELKAYALNELARLAHRAEYSQKKAAEKKVEGDALQTAVKEALTGEFATIDEIVDRVTGEGVTKGKVSARLTKLVAAGIAEKEQHKFGKGSESRKVMCYKLAGVESEVEVEE